MRRRGRGRVVHSLLLALLLGIDAVCASIESLRFCGYRGNCSMLSTPEARLPPQEMSHYWKEAALCYCDSECEVYSDCCPDMATTARSSNILGIPSRFWDCVPISPNVSVYAVNGCPEERAEENQLCRKKVIRSEEYHYTLDVPVFSTVLKAYFANIFCAYCYYPDPGLKSSSMKILCSSNVTRDQILSEGVYQAGEGTWLVGDALCSMALDPEKSSRICKSSVDTCPQNWTKREIVNSCQAYSLSVRNKHTFYKNPHCALCNGEDPMKLNCLPSKTSRIQPELPSLAVVMDFNWELDWCKPPGEVWDPLRRSCGPGPCPPGGCPQLPLSDRLEGYLTTVCLLLSLCCLTLHLCLFFLLPKLRTLPSKILAHLSFALILAHALFLLGLKPLFPLPLPLCQAVASLIHYFFLAAFFWMNVMSFDVWRTFSSSLKPDRNSALIKYCCYAWGAPLLLVVSCLVLDLLELLPRRFRPFYGHSPGTCWFANRAALGLYLYLPASLLLVSNGFMFGITVWQLQKSGLRGQLLAAHGRREVARLWLYSKLSTIMGLAWVSGVIAALTDLRTFWYFFVVFNGLQGAFIFLMFDLKSNVLALLVRNNQEAKSPSGSAQNPPTRSSKLSTSTSSHPTISN